MNVESTKADPTERSGGSGPAKSGNVALLRRLGPAGLLAIIAAVLPGIGGFVLLAYIPRISEWLRQRGAEGPALYAGAFVACTGLALVPTYALSALGGYAFGMVWGVGAALIGLLGGAIVGFEVARRADQGRVMEIVRERPRLSAVRDALVSDETERGFWRTTGVIALVRLPPNSPFALTNIVLASVGVSRLDYILGTVAGMLPRTAAVAWIGHSAGLAASGEFVHPRWMLVAGIVMSLGVLGVIMAIANRALGRVLGPEQPTEAEPA